MHTPLLLFLGDIGGSEALLIVVAILVFFGANKIPELARGLGKGIREFKDASREIRSEIENAGQPTQQHHYSTSSYQPPTPAPSEHYVAPESTVAPPMDGGITPPPAERSRLDQTTN